MSSSAKLYLAAGILFLVVFSISFWLFFPKDNSLLRPVSETTQEVVEKPLEKYAYENLKLRTFEAVPIEFGEIRERNERFSSRLFSYLSDGKKVSGLAHLPPNPGIYPILLQFRGFVPLEIYESGVGTKHSAEVFAQNGFISLSPDFLGYGESASPSALPIEERFETYTTALNLLASVKNLNRSLKASGVDDIVADEDHIAIWGHSNGGQIALTVLEVSGVSYPTVLWAPVTKPFPYSILYYTDEYEDHGKALRKLVAGFEEDYDVENYSIPNYLAFINAPIELHQGTGDDAIPLEWSDEFYRNLKNLGKDITYYTYPGDDHDFSKGSWGTVVARNIAFYKKHFSR